MFIALNKLGLHRLELFLSRHELLRQLFPQSLLSLQTSSHLVVCFLQLSTLFSKILVNSFELLHDGHVFVGIHELYLHILQLILMTDELRLLLEQLVFHLLILSLHFLPFRTQLFRLLLLRLESQSHLGQLISQFVEIECQLSVFIFCFTIQYLFLLHILSQFLVIFPQFSHLRVDLVSLSFDLIALVDCCIELVEQEQFFLIYSAIFLAFYLLCLKLPNLSDQSLAFSPLITQLLSQRVNFIQICSILPLPLRIRHWAKTEPQRHIISIIFMLFCWTDGLHLHIHSLQWRLYPFLHLIGAHNRTDISPRIFPCSLL